MYEEERDKLRKVGTTHLEGRYIKFIVDENNVETKFEFLRNRRDLRKTNVRKLAVLLGKGEHFETPLVANKLDGIFRLIDGNHRIEAVKLFLGRFPKRRVEIGIMVYDNLNEQEEKELFTKWNMGAKQVMNDFIKQYWDDMPITSKLRTPHFPWNISHCWTKKSMEFRQLMYVYVERHNNNTIFRGGALDLINQCKKLDHGDYQLLKTFLSEYMEIFGNPDRVSPLYKTGVFYPLMRIWLTNYRRIPPGTMKKKFKKLIGHERIMHWSTPNIGRSNHDFAIADFLKIINGNTADKSKILYAFPGDVPE